MANPTPTPYDPLRDEQLTATALRVILESDLQCHNDWTFDHGDWAPDGTFVSSWTWQDTRTELAMWETRIGSGTEFLMDSDNVMNLFPLVTGMSQHDMARTIYAAVAAQIDSMTHEQAAALRDLAR